MALIFITSCQSNSKKKVDDDVILRQRTFAEELFLPLVTPWNNASDAYSCVRESDWLYLNMNEVFKKTGVSFKQRLNLQYQVNVLWNQKKPAESYSADQMKFEKQYSQKLLPNDRLSFLEQAVERVNGGVNFWELPEGQYDIWLIEWDLIPSQREAEFMGVLLAMPEIKNVIPIIISHCRSSFSIRTLLESRPELLSFSFILGAELLTPFKDGDLVIKRPLHHPLEVYFKDLSRLIWVLPIESDLKLKKQQILRDGKASKVLYIDSKSVVPQVLSSPPSSVPNALPVQNIPTPAKSTL